MRAVLKALLLLPLVACAALPEPGTPGAPADARYCGEPERDARGRIKRSEAVKRQYARVVPCPVPGVPRGEPSCPGWHLNHTWPLGAGGCDTQENLSWMPVQIKVCRKDAPYNTDCWERKVYAPR